MDERKDGSLQKADLMSMYYAELENLLLEMGEKKFRGSQIFDWIHKKHARSFADMTNLPAALRDRLGSLCAYGLPKQVTVQESAIDGTRKYLFEFSDGQQVESVFMRYHHGNSVCISSQAGCRMGCRFCASTLNGLARNLTAGEMLSQIYCIEEDIGERISNIVIMGTGEPFDNYDGVLRFLHLIHDERGAGVSMRNLTVSTCGVVPGILRFAKENLPVTLALSLHAPTQKKRERLMPVARKYPLDQVMDACEQYYKSTGRRVTFEYSLIAGENDSAQDAQELHRLLGGKNCHVNLIPVNPVEERTYSAPDMKAVRSFKNKLENYGINVTIRREMGRDIDGACGQLRKRYADQADYGTRSQNRIRS